MTQKGTLNNSTSSSKRMKSRSYSKLGFTLSSHKEEDDKEVTTGQLKLLLKTNTVLN